MGKKNSKKKMGAPKRRTCACMQVHYRQCDQDPAFRDRSLRIENETNKNIASRRVSTVDKVVKIPVVVHVVYKKASENISDAQIKSQIGVLNKDYRALNADKSKVPSSWKSFVGDTRIEFALATRDPRKKPTTGITRTTTLKDYFGTGDAVKSNARGGKSPWSTSKYLNIWVCTLGGGLLGYAQFPGGPKNTDGVVILNTALGTQGVATAPFNKGRTCTHEVGHWLNLRHIWGDLRGCGGTDYVIDTPDAQLPNYNSPTFPHITCNNGPHGDMFMNYMDYVDDASMFMFTQGQVARMRATLSGPRKSFLR